MEEQIIGLLQDFGISGVLLFIWYTELRSIKGILQKILDK
jgi:hypothetical protein